MKVANFGGIDRRKPALLSPKRFIVYDIAHTEQLNPPCNQLIFGANKMTTYYLDFVNKTKKIWTMGVYQTIPESTGLDSVAWKRATVPPGGTSGVFWDFNISELLFGIMGI